MMMMLAMTLVLLIDAYDAIAYDLNADAKIPNDPRHFAGAYALMLMSPLLPILMLLRQLLRADACDDVMLKCVCICVRLRLYVARVCVMFVYVS